MLFENLIIKQNSEINASSHTLISTHCYVLVKKCLIVYLNTLLQTYPKAVCSSIHKRIQSTNQWLVVFFSAYYHDNNKCSIFSANI